MASDLLFPADEIADKSNQGKQDELFVFGYSCKLFRDDDQARLVDGGKYMIPWMGDERLKIDRYDGRGHLFDLSAYDADLVKKGGELSEEEKRIEQMCDEERYLELHTDVVEKAMYEEEEWKRYYESLSEGYKAVGFSYDYYGQQENAQGGLTAENEEDKPFVPPKELQLPEDVQIPLTVKENVIIEKTAMFIAKHGLQMEIMVKTKQSKNDQFLFMYFENELHPYYRHMVQMIKTNKYVPKLQDEEENHDDSGEMEDGHHGYLHPTLLTSNRASPTPEVYKPLTVQMPKVSIHETPYGQLLQSFSKVNKDVEEKQKARELKEMKAHGKQSKKLPDGMSDTYGPSLPPPPGLEPVTLPADVKQEEESSDSPEHIVPPPPDVQPIVDRMAMYVAKNGDEFEIVVKSKKDPRFQFLESWHMHFSYYSFKKHLFIQEMAREKEEKELEEKRKEQEKAESLAKGVKFKLKKVKEPESTTLENKKIFDNDESSEEEAMNGHTDKVKETKGRSSQSGTSTPVTDTDTTDSKSDEHLEKKIAEQRVRDRLAASAREKLSQVDKEKQKREERKKKAAMFLSLLKNKSGEEESDTKQSSQPGSGRSSPVKKEEISQSSRQKSPDNKSRDRSKSRERSSKSKHKRSRSRDRRSRSRDRRSRDKRSRSSSRSKSKKKKRKRSLTPPSAYAVTRRSPPRYAPPTPSYRYMDVKSRHSRSPSGALSSRHRTRSRSPAKHSSRHRSRSRSKSKTKSKKKKRSKSPKSKHEDGSSHKKKSSKKKKKRSKSRSPKHKRSKISPIPESPSGDTTQAKQKLDVSKQDVRVIPPALDPDEVVTILDDNEEVEEGEMVEESTNEQIEKSPSEDGGITEIVKRVERSHSRSSSIDSHHSSRSPSETLRSRSRSPSPSSKNSPAESGEVTPVPSDVNDGENSNVSESSVPKNVSSYMINRVRAIIQASKEAIKQEEDMFADT